MVRRASLFLAVLVVVDLAASRPLFADDVSWTNAGGGLWNTPGNWSTNSVPGPGDRALVTLDGTYTVTLDVNASVAALVLGGGSGQQTLSGSGRTLTATDSVFVGTSGVLDLSGSTVNGTMKNQGRVVMRQTSAFSGASTNEAGATLRVLGASGGSANLVVGPLTNHGTIELTTTDGNFHTTLSGSGPVTNQAGSAFRVLVGTGGERHLQAPMVNRGTVTVEFPLYLDNGTLSQLNDVGGTVELTTGDLILTQSGAGSFTNQGAVSIGAGRVFAASGGSFSNSGTLAGSGTLTLNGVTLTGSVSPPSSLLLDLTNCTVNAALTNLGLLVAHGSNTFSTSLTNETGATLRNLGGSGSSAMLTIAGSATNRGTIELTSTGGNLRSNLLGTGTLTNEAGGVLSVLVGTGGERHLEALLVNRGMVTLNQPLYLDNAGKSYLNDTGGTIDVTNADLIVTQSAASPSFANLGTVNVAAGHTLSISGGTFTNSGTLAGAGSFVLSTLTANLNTLLTLPFATVSATNSIVNAPSGLVNGAATTLTLSTATVNATVTNQGVLVGKSNSTLNGALTNEAGATLRVLGASGGSANLAVGPVTNYGAIELTTTDGNFHTTLSGSGPVTNQAGSAFRVLVGTGGERHLQAPMVNRGTVTVEFPLYLDNGTLSQLNDVGGTIELTTGDVILTQSGAGSFSNRGILTVGSNRTFAISGGSFLNDVAGTLRGSGTISSGPSIVNAGTISPGTSPGRLSFTGNVVQSATGRVRIELAGTQPISGYDVLSCSGQITLGGTLEVAVLGGFVPPAGSPYVAIKYGAHTGTFSAFEGLDLGGGLQFSPTYTDTAVILSTGPIGVTSVTSNHGGNAGVVTTVIHGVGFFDGLTAWLARGAEQIPAQITGVSPYGTSFAAVFDLTGATLGAWDVVVHGTDGSIITVPGGFTVEAPQPPEITTWILGSPRVRFGSTAYYDIVCTNQGNTDAFTVPLWISGIPAGSPWSLSPPDADPPVFSGDPVDYSNAPLAVGTATDSSVALMLMRVPAGQSVQLRLSVHPTSQASFPLKVWSEPSFETTSTVPATSTILDANPNSAIVECLFGLAEFGFDCFGLAVPGASCGHGLIVAFLGTMTQAAHTAYSANVTHPNDNVSYVCGIIKCYGAGIIGPLAVECGSEVLPILKIWEIVQCALSEGQAIAGCDDALPHLGESSITVSPVTSHDPNDKAGPSGVGFAQYVRRDTPIPYTIHFENLATATAPAAEVVIADTLDATKFDPATVALGPIHFGDHFFQPAPGSTSCLGTVDLRPTANLVVKIDARLDPGSGVLTWRLSSIDPDTGLPPTDPDVGFLPPNAVQPEGEGSVQYTVRPLGGAPTGTQLGNQASIVFDANDPIVTPVWTNTIDATAPVSAVAELPAVTNILAFEVQWNGSDADSHLEDYTLHVSVDGGPDSVWLTHVTQTSGVFTGQAGHTYAFYSVARDSAGNTEAAPAQPDAQTQISSLVGAGARPRVPIFALYGARPNPADARLRVFFELPTGAPASLDLYDIAGRRVAHRAVGDLGPGPHTIDLGAGARVRPGIYFVRLQQGIRSALKRVVVTR